MEVEAALGFHVKLTHVPFPHHLPIPPFRLVPQLDATVIQLLGQGLPPARSGPATSRRLLLPFNGLFSRTTWVSRYQKDKTNLDFTEARDSEWQWHQLGHMQVCTSLQTDNHTSTPPLCFLQAGCPSCRPTNSVKALKAQADVCQQIFTSATERIRLHGRT